MVQKETKTSYYSGKVVAGGDNLLAGRVYLTTENLIELRGSITPRQVITGDVLLHIPDYDFDTYRGPLELTPTASGFDVSTKGKIMLRYKLSLTLCLKRKRHSYRQTVRKLI